MKFDEVASIVNGIPHMTLNEGRVVYDHVLKTKPSRILEIGTANGVSASYMAAALDELGQGGVVETVDSEFGAHEHCAARTIDAVGLGERVRRVTLPHSSYNWWLKEQIVEYSDDSKNVSPRYGFCYLDGAHNFTVDGLAFFLISHLLEDEGWILFDDLNWSYASSASGRTSGVGELPMSSVELHAQQMRELFDYVVMASPDFSNFVVQDENWGWAQKTEGRDRRLHLEISESLLAKADRVARRLIKSATRR